MIETRTVETVFADHLRLRQEHRLDEDIARNYAPDVVLLTMAGTFYGHPGVRQSAAILADLLPEGRYDYEERQVEREYAFLEWRGYGANGAVAHGADGYVIRDGRIAAQIIYYDVEPA